MSTEAIVKLNSIEYPNVRDWLIYVLIAYVQIICWHYTQTDSIYCLYIRMTIIIINNDIECNVFELSGLATVDINLC